MIIARFGQSGNVVEKGKVFVEDEAKFSRRLLMVCVEWGDVYHSGVTDQKMSAFSNCRFEADTRSVCRAIRANKTAVVFAEQLLMLRWTLQQPVSVCRL